MKEMGYIETLETNELAVDSSITLINCFVLLGFD